jgi:hypothetical protein
MQAAATHSAPVTFSTSDLVFRATRKDGIRQSEWEELVRRLGRDGAHAAVAAERRAQGLERANDMADDLVLSWDR